MTIFLLANSIFILGSMAYGWLAGDRHDREGVAWIVAALLGTALAQSFAQISAQALVIQGVDVALLIAMISLALRSDRYWPTWFAGLQFATVCMSSAALLYPDLARLHTIGAFFGTLAILAMVIGIFLDRRAADRLRAPTARRAET